MKKTKAMQENQFLTPLQKFSETCSVKSKKNDEPWEFDIVEQFYKELVEVQKMMKQKYLVIPNEDMPNACLECPCLRHDSFDGINMWQCNLTFKAFDDIPIERPESCPLQEVWLDPEDLEYGERVF